MNKFRFIAHLVALIVVLFIAVRIVPQSFAQNTGTVFTPATLAVYDGKNGHKAYVAYKGVVYDVTGQPNWGNGEHYGNLAGQDLTGMMAGAPHGEEVLANLPVIGTFALSTPVPSASSAQVPTVATNAAAVVTPLQAAGVQSAIPSRKAWYQVPIRIAGLSVLGWTGILLGVAFVLNFATCFALPWSKLPLPWKGSRPGPDPLDATPVRLRWTAVHKYFAWATVVLGILHGIIGLMQLLGYVI